MLLRKKSGEKMAVLISDEIKAVIEGKLTELGLELFDLKYFQAGSRAVLRIIIDSPSGVTVGDCERVSNELSPLLDVENFAAGRPYTLEISSPGIDRQLKTERDFKRVIGRIVVLQMAPAWTGKKTLRGTVIGCAEGILQIEIDETATDIALTSVASGKEEIQFR